MTRSPTPDMLAAAAGRTVPDVVAPRLDVLFCGINPGLWSAAVGHHFARPGNRFWRVLHEAGFTPELLGPSEDRRLLEYGFGVTNLVRRSSAGAAELTRDELREGARSLGETTATFEPRLVAVLGMGAFRVAFGQPKATLGEQPWELSGAGLWLLPNPSGLQARYQLADLVEQFGKLRVASQAR